MPITSHSKSDPLNRLARISGHLDAVIRMVDSERYCVDVIHQIKAVQAGLDKVSEELLRNHLNTCVVDAIQSQDEERVLSELMAIFKKAPQLYDLDSMPAPVQSNSEATKTGCCGNEHTQL